MRYLRYYLKSHSGLAQLLRFSTVATSISLIDIGGVYLLPYYFSINIYLARLLSLSTANSTGFMLNRYFTFDTSRKGPFFKQMVKHIGVHFIGGLINFSVFSMIIAGRNTYGENSISYLLFPSIALLAGGIAGMCFNFCCCRKFVFHSQPCKFESLP